ncbi:3-phosphoshikimate 1-carboxyvinyltransferase [Salinarimonas chemoclinalis]|uniref:3-phosphoshikimate 1-carboxyvinyltransferase n=1 Tax=Salinarimonas chemoclinalis TaxID=3241599 RepID=UPI003557DDF4
MAQIVPPSANHAPFVARVPGSKSYTNRALVIAAQKPGETTIENALHAVDTDRLAACLDAFDGLSVTRTEKGYRVVREDRRLGAPSEPVYIAGAGTPARFLLAFAAMADGATTVTGNARLSERPMADILRAFDGMGVRYEALEKPDLLPLRIHGGPISADAWTVSGEVSSQFLSALVLLAAQQPQGPVTVRVPGHLVSRPYVMMTLEMLRGVGVAVTCPDAQTFVVQPGVPSADTLTIEPDASAMSYFLGLAAISGVPVTVPGIGPGSAQGDVGFARLLERMGCGLAVDARGLTITRGARLVGIEADMETMPDTVLTLAAVAAYAEGETRITNIANLRVKECDRIHAAAAELGRVGVCVEEGPDWLVIRPGGRIAPATIETYDDHRVAMAFSLLTLAEPGIGFADPACVAKSFPGYWDELGRFLAHRVSRAA